MIISKGKQQQNSWQHVMGFRRILSTLWLGINEIQCWPFFPRQALLTICGPSKVSTKWRRLDLREMLKVYWGICRIWKAVGRLQSGNMSSDDHYHHIRYYQTILACYTACLSYVYTYADVIFSNDIWRSPPAFFQTDWWVKVYWSHALPRLLCTSLRDSSVKRRSRPMLDG